MDNISLPLLNVRYTPSMKTSSKPTYAGQLSEASSRSLRSISATKVFVETRFHNVGLGVGSFQLCVLQPLSFLHVRSLYRFFDFATDASSATRPFDAQSAILSTHYSAALSVGSLPAFLHVYRNPSCNGDYIVSNAA